MRRVVHWVGGKPWDGASARSAEVHDPATGAVTTEVALADAADVDTAVAAAQEAWPAWRDTPLVARSKVLFAFRELVVRHRDTFAAAITAEHGKTLPDARGEVDRGLEVVEFACGLPQLLKGEISADVTSGVDSYTVRQPLGVVAGVTPFNFPVMVPMWMYPVAIAAGNAFVLKPSPLDPTPAQLVAELWAEAGLPDGVFSVLHGDREAVEALLDAPGVQAVSFVGSTAVARSIYTRGAAAGKRVQALGGAKNHMVVLPDADLDRAAEAAVAAAYGSAGQRCMAVSALVAVGGVGDPLVDRVADRLRGLRIGPGVDAASEMGPLVSAAARDRVASYVDTTDATVVIDGRDASVEGHPGGFWHGPTLLDHVIPAMPVYRDEIFGPLLVVLRVDDLDDALRLVADNPYGNGVAVFTADGAAARRFSHEVQCGMVGVNVPIPVPMAFHSFGGWKQSMFGDLPVHGSDGFRFYTRAKVVTARWTAAQSRVPLAFPTSD